MAIVEIIPMPKQMWLQDHRIRVDSHWGVINRSPVAGLDQAVVRQFGVSGGGRERNFIFEQKEGLGSEAYRVEIVADAVRVAAADCSGFHHALATLGQLRHGPELVAGSVEDWPRIPVRGIHFMFETFEQLDAAEALRLIDTAARFKLNTILMEFGDRFPFTKHAEIVSPNALTPDDIAAMVRRADEYGITIIPLLQSLGHLEYVLRHDRYRPLSEDPATRTQLCPIDPGSLNLWRELAEEVLAAFPACRMMHIGGDETWELGKGRSRDACARLGKGRLYTDYVNPICAWLGERKVTPILWDDMLCTHPESMASLDPRVWIMYWDYWTTCDPSPLIVARSQADRDGLPVDRCLMYDQHWGMGGGAGLSDVTRATLKAFGRPVDLTRSLDATFLNEFGSCLGDGMPRQIRAFPYLEYYRDHGRQVFCGPTCSGNHSKWNDLPDFPRFGDNIKTFADRCIQAGTPGLITTCWYNRVPEMLSHGMLLTSQFTW